MAELRCVHGLDARFCSICNKSRPNKEQSVRRGPVGAASLPEIIQFLNHQQIRATYGAVAEVLGVIPRSMGARLGGAAHNREASWVVSKETELPTDYAEHEMHPALRRKREVITSGVELAKRLSEWKAARD
jgi:hypothetical protein